MRIGVISPIRHSGATTVTLLLAAAIAQTQTHTVCLTYTGEGGDLKDYAGAEIESDPTRTLTQVARMLNAKSIAKEELVEYCVSISPNVKLLDTAGGAITDDETTLVLTQIFANITTDAVICDITTDLDDDITKEILKLCDIAVIVTTMTKSAGELTRRYKESSLFPKDKPACILVNRFDPSVISIGQLAAELNSSVRNTCKLPYSPLILKACRMGQIVQAMINITAYDYRMLALNTAMKELLQFIYGTADKRMKWDGKRLQ
jgi:cellulose biosynthesis protein BcsQ